MAESPEEEARTAQIPAQPRETAEPAEESAAEAFRDAPVPRERISASSAAVVEELPAHDRMVLEKVDHELSGLTVGDGFRFGCGFALASAIGLLILLILATAFLTVGTLMGFKLPA